MSERDGYEAGVPCWVQAVEPDAGAAARFYAELFGWEADDLMPADSPASYYVCTHRGREVAAVVSQHGAPAPPAAAWTTHVWVESADAAAVAAVDAGGSVIGEPFDSPGGGRMAVLADPAGAAFCVWEPRARRGAQVVNEPGAWAMSQLVTPDPEGATRFYGAVFGWQTESFALGDSEVTLWRVPGYVGGEPEQPVSREVVAAMAPVDSGTPAQWSVDFWIADADGAAARTAELGGRVVEPPHDVPGFRRAVLADPQGAAFSVSQLMLGG